MSSKKLKLDQYFTSPEVAEYCFKKTLEVIGEENISEFIESSAGECVFLDMIEKYTPNIPYKAYDIDVRDERVIEQDFLKLEMEYKKGRCIIGNPPFGFMTKLIIQFYKKSIALGDYISFIMPLSFKDNTKQVFDFDLVYSEDLGLQKYSDRDIHCSFNIYKRGINGLNKSKTNRPIKLKDVNIIEVRQGNKRVDKFDYAICSWGSVGKEISSPNTKEFAKEFYIVINNKQYKDRVINLLKKVNWIKEYDMKNTPNLLQWEVYEYLKLQIPELE